VSFSLARGEILGIAGLVGSGRSELALAIAGLTPPPHGEVLVQGRREILRTAADGQRAGVVLLPEDRKAEGLIGQLSVRENISLGITRRLSGALGRIDLTGEVLAYWRQAEATGVGLRTSTSRRLGKDALLVSPFSLGEVPANRAEYDRLKTLAGTPLLAWIDPQTGLLLHWARVAPVANGEGWAESSSFELALIERVDAPPQSARWLLQQVGASAGGGLVIVPPEARTPDERLTVEVDALLRRGFDDLYGQPGWVHVSSENEDGFPSSSASPAHSFGDFWQYVESDSSVSRSLWQQKDARGALVRSVARVGQTVMDLLAGTASEDTVQAKAKMNAVAERILAAGEKGIVVRGEEALLDGRACLVVTETETYTPAMTLSGFTNPVRQAQTRTWIERSSGQVLREETALTDSTGKVYRAVQRYLLQERATPPQSVLDALKKVAGR